MTTPLYWFVSSDVVWQRLKNCLVFLILVCSLGTLRAQERILVVDDQGYPVSFAVVRNESGTSIGSTDMDGYPDTTDPLLQVVFVDGKRVGTLIRDTIGKMYRVNMDIVKARNEPKEKRTRQVTLKELDSEDMWNFVYGMGEDG